MQKVWRLRAMGSMCRQQAAYDPPQRCRFIAEAEYWEKLAEHELSLHYEECNSYHSSDVPIGGSLHLNDRQWEPIVAA
jgi:hypothetical protein